MNGYPELLSFKVGEFRFLLMMLLLFLPACGAPEVDAPMEITLTSSAFTAGEGIPAQYSCDGDDSSPPLQWANLPTGTETVALIMDDPDAPIGTWVHWVLYDVPAGVSGLPAGIAATETVPGGGAQGSNSWERLGYGGPCPPSGEHRYFFKLYALDGELGLDPGATKEELLAAMEGRVLAQGELIGVYARE